MLLQLVLGVPPNEAHADRKGHTNFFAGTPLNRLAWLRTSPVFLNTIVELPATRWVLFNEGKPLMHTSGPSGPTLARLSTEDVRPLLGSQPFFSQAAFGRSVISCP